MHRNNPTPNLAHERRRKRESMLQEMIDGKPYAANPHVRFDAREVASARPRHMSLFRRSLSILTCVLTLASVECVWGRTHTIMAYDSDGHSSTLYTGIPYFSNPNAYYEGTPVGDRIHNNALTLSETCGVVASFRTAKDAQSEDDDEAVELGEAFGFNWRTSKGRPWTESEGEELEKDVSVHCLQSGDFRVGNANVGYKEPAQGCSWIETEISGPCDFGFLVYAYYMNGPITVSLDGEEVCRKVPHKFTRPYRSSYSVTYGDDAIEWLTVQVPEGVHKVRLSFVADGWFCGYNVYNGLTLYDVRLSKKGYRPIITPASSYSEDYATTFSNSCVVTITNSVPAGVLRSRRSSPAHHGCAGKGRGPEAQCCPSR